MRYLLDTHVLVWWLLEDRKLAKEHQRLLRRSDARGESVALSTISLWEMARLASRRRLRGVEQPIDEWLEQVEASPRMTVLPLTARIASDSTRLGIAYPSDPVDQIIGATARCHGLTLLTSDERILASGAVVALG